VTLGIIILGDISIPNCWNKLSKLQIHLRDSSFITSFGRVQSVAWRFSRNLSYLNWGILLL
jgi:hypothetical protein